MADQRPATIRRNCPLESCDWHHDDPDRLRDPNLLAGLPEVDQAAFAAAGGDVAFAILLADYARVETILREHFDTHPLEEWVLEVVRLRENVRRLTPGGWR
jgi:hypothetical protein